MISVFDRQATLEGNMLDSTEFGRFQWVNLVFDSLANSTGLRKKKKTRYIPIQIFQIYKRTLDRFIYSVLSTSDNTLVVISGVSRGFHLGS